LFFTQKSSSVKLAKENESRHYRQLLFKYQGESFIGTGIFYNLDAECLEEVHVLKAGPQGGVTGKWLKL
jgi:hypothetical protein